MMDRRSVWTGLSASGLVASQAGAQTPASSDPGYRDSSARMSGDVVFTDPAIADNHVARCFGHVPALDSLLPTVFETEDGTRRFSDLRGRMVLVCLWSEAIQSSLGQIRDLAVLKQRIHDPRFDVVALLTASAYRLDFPSARKRVDEVGAKDVDVWIEPHGGRTVYDAYCYSAPLPRSPRPIQALPTVLMFDDDGTLRARMMGLRLNRSNMKISTENLMPLTIWSMAEEAEAFVGYNLRSRRS